ncbi:MAG: L-fuculokinase [Bacteroidales bacterium]|nr:L-fuculokinase [Bacteroidales bacterium]
MQKVVLVLDCGATNIRTIAVDAQGHIRAVSSVANNTRPDPYYPEYRIWDVKEIWGKFRQTTADVLQKIPAGQIAAITVTTFGVDGAPFTAGGKILYPVISWQCPRTIPVMKNIENYIPLEELYGITGLQPYNFNTITKLIWLKENKPEIVEQMDHFLFISSIFLYYLTGEMVTDTTMAGTSMLTDLKNRRFSENILEHIGFSSSLFPNLCEPGTVVGKTGRQAGESLGLREGIPVIATGHDTQFAIYGSGAEEEVPVLSSGTWEILMVRSGNVNLDPDLLRQGVTTEFDPIPGHYDIGVQWIGSGTLEWIRNMLYRAEAQDKGIYDLMIGEAEKTAPGSNGVRIDPSFYPGSADAGTGMITGLNMNSRRGEIYRAALEALSCRTRKSLGILEGVGNFTAQQLLVVGGGARNQLWNQLRSDIIGIPVRVVDQKETTVLGSALFALAGTGVYGSPDEARQAVQYKTEDYFPSGKRESYEWLYEDYMRFFESRQ